MVILRLPAQVNVVEFASLYVDSHALPNRGPTRVVRQDPLLDGTGRKPFPFFMSGDLDRLFSDHAGSTSPGKLRQGCTS
jgi:hypothetical protein